MKRLFLILLCLSLLLSACGAQTAPSQDVFYYPKAESDRLPGVFGTEPRLFPEDASISELLDLYCAGPESAELESLLPPGTAIRSWDLRDGILRLDFNAGLSQLSGIELTVTAACMARTFLERFGAQTLVLTAEGSLLNGETSMRMSLSDLNLRDNSPDRLHQKFTVYYASTDRRYLIGQELSVQVISPNDLPMQLLELLLTPPEDSGLRSALPTGTRFHSVTVENGLCTVDLSPEFDSRRYSAMSAQCLSLLSIVNTLTALPQIQRVEFPIDDNLLIRYGSLSIAEPLVQDLRCLGPVRTGLGERDSVIYLVHGSEDLLVPIPARLRLSASQPLPELVIRCLLQDPGTNGIRSRIPPGTRLNSIRVAGGTCYVDLNEQYLSSDEHLRSAGRVIAASLCMLDEIDRVQILVNGQVPHGYDSSLFGILTPNADWFL